MHVIVTAFSSMYTGRIVEGVVESNKFWDMVIDLEQLGNSFEALKIWKKFSWYEYENEKNGAYWKHHTLDIIVFGVITIENNHFGKI